MAKYSNTVEYNIRTTLDSSGITKLQAELAQLQNHLTRWSSKGLIDASAFNKTLADIKTVQNALQQAFNPKLGMLNTSAFMKNLKAQGLTLKGVYESFSNAGTKGIQTFTSMYGQISKLDTGLRSMSKTTDKIMNTIGNTMRWGLIASGFSQIMNAAHQTVEYVKELDTSLTNIMMVSGQSRDNMNEFAKAANEVAQRLGATTTQMTEAAKVFVQQGMNTQESLQMGEYAVHLANISEQDSATTSDELTAMKNAFKINIDDMGNAISKWAAIANNTAVDMEELSVASQKAASVAQTTGVDMEQFAGHIAAIEATTREAPENIGNGLKTLYSRFADIKLGETLEDGVDLGKFSQALEKVGVQVLDNEGKMKDVGVILEDTMNVWQKLDKTQQNALATTVAGRFQLGRFEALMNSQDIYQTAIGAARNETGTETYDRMQETYRESLEGRGRALQAKVEEIFNNLFTTDTFGGAIDAVTGLADALNTLIEATGGGQTAILGLSTVLFGIAKESMSRGISNFIQNRQADVQGRQNLANQEQQAKNVLLAGGLRTGNERLDSLSKNVAGMNQYATELNGEQREKVNSLIQQSIELENGLAEAKKRRKEATEQLRAIAASEGAELSEITYKLIEEINVLEQNGQQINVNSENYQKFASLVQNTGSAISQFTEKMQQNAGQFSAGEIQIYIRYLQNLAQQEGITAEKAELLNKAARQLSVFAQGGNNVKVLQTALQNANVTIAELSDTLNSVPPKLEQVTNSFFSATQAETEFAAGANFVRDQMVGVQEAFNLQHMINQVSNVVMGIGQLGFAVQSLRNIGSIWTNEDLSLGEKVLDTVVNLSMSLPMAIMGAQQLADGYKALKAANDGYKVSMAEAFAVQKAMTAVQATEITLTQAEIAFCEANSISKQQLAAAQLLVNEGKAAGIMEAIAMVTAEGAETVATNILTAAIGRLRVALTGLIASPIGIFLLAAAAAATAAGIAFDSYSRSIDAANEATAKAVETVNNEAQIQQQVKDYDDLYNQWKQTGEGADQLASSAKAMGEALNVVGADILAESGNFDVLNQKIQESIEKHKEYKKEAEESALRGLNRQITEHNLFKGDDNFGRKYLMPEFTDSPERKSAIENARLATGQSIDFNGNLNDNLSIEERLGNIKNAAESYKNLIEETKNKQQELLNENPRAKDDNTEAWQNLQKELESRQATSDIINSMLDDEQSKDAFSVLEQKAKDAITDFDVESLYGASNLEELTSKLMENEDLNQYITALGETAGKDYIEGILQVLAAASENDQFKDLINSLFPKEIDTEEQKRQNQLNTTTQRKERILKDSSIDKSDFPAYQEKFKSVGGVGFDDGNTNTLLEQNSILEEQIQQLDKAKDALQNYGQVLDEHGNIVKTVNKDSKEFKQEISALTKRSEQLEKQFSESNAEIEDMALRCLETNKGVEELAKVWKDVGDSFYDLPVEKATELDVAVSKILNLPAGTLTDAFYVDPSNMELLQRIAEGDMEALSDLRAAASENIAVRIAVENGLEDGQTEELINYINQMKNMLPDIEVGATINDQQFIAGLNNLLAASNLSAQQIDSIFGTLGYEVEPMPVELSFPSISSVASGAIQMMQGAMSGNGGLIASGATQISTTVTQETAKATGFRFRKIGGGGGGNGYTPSTGGSGGGGGGGGGGGKGKAPQTVSRSSAPQDSEIDLYNKVNATLEKLGKQYDNLEKKKSKLWGEQYRKAVEEETANLLKQNEQLKRSNDITQDLIKAYQTKKGVNKDRGIDLHGETLEKYNLTDVNNDGVIDNYINTYTDAHNAADRAMAKADKYWKQHGGKLNKDGTVKKEAKMSDSQKKTYDEMVKKANALYDKADKINDVTNKYQEAWAKAAEEAEKMTEVSDKLKDLQIDLWNRAQDAIDNIKDLNEDMAYTEGFFTGLNKNSPFRALTEDIAKMDRLLVSTTKDVDGFMNSITKNVENEKVKAIFNDMRARFGNEVGDGTSILGMQEYMLSYLQSEEGKNQFYSTNYTVGKDGQRKEERIFDMQAYQEALSVAYKATVATMKDIESAREDVVNHMIDAFNEYQDRLDEISDRFDYQNAKLEHMYNMIKKIHGESSKAYEDLIMIDEAAVEAYIGADGSTGRIAELQQQYQMWQQQLTAQEKRINETLGHNASFAEKMNDEVYKDLYQKVEDAGEKVRQETEAAADAMLKLYEDRNTKIAKDFTNKMLQAGIDAANGRATSNGGAFLDAEFFEKQWEMAKDKADAYLDTVESTYEIDKLRGRYQKMINETASNEVTTRNRIKAAMDEQLKALKEQKKIVAGLATEEWEKVYDKNGEIVEGMKYQNALSQFDVDLANAKVELLQKQIALEDAQRNKNQMQLRRDTQGNYNFVYTADQDSVADAQQALADSEYEIYEMSKQRYGDLLQVRYQLLQEYNDKVAWANETYKADEAAKAKALAEIGEWFKERQLQIQMELGDAQAGMIEGVQHLAEDTTDQVKQTFENISQDMQENWDETLTEIGVLQSEALQNMAADASAFIGLVDNELEKANETTVKLNNSITKLGEQAQESFSNVGDEVTNVKDEMKELNQITEEYMKIINSDTGGLADATQKLKTYSLQITELQSKASNLAASLNEAQTAKMQAEQENIEFRQKEQAIASKSFETGQKVTLRKGTVVYYGRGGGQKASDGKTYKLPADTNVTIYRTNLNAMDSKGNLTNEIAKYPIEIFPTGQTPVPDRDSSPLPKSRIDEMWHINSESLADNAYDTGGYTGAWDEDTSEYKNGKWALLHQKELVLNQEDTSNILTAVNVVRKIVDGLKMFTNPINLLSLGGLNSGGRSDTIEQRVEINAEFPNVDDASDVRQALLGLADSAYQYSYREKGK